MSSWIGKFIQASIHAWLNTTGRKVDFIRFPFLLGPMADEKVIGESFYHKVAEKEQLGVRENVEGGLVGDFRETIDPANPLREALQPEIADFYEQTSRYGLEVWSKWIPPVSWSAKLLIRMVSTEMKQLNMPLDALDTSYGMSSDIIHLADRDGTVKYTCWLRKSNKTGSVVYAGFYSGIQVGNQREKHVRVVFPLPSGNVTVLLRSEVQKDGSVRLISGGRRFGETGYYRLHRNRNGVVKAQKMPIKEVIHVFKDATGTLRTDHSFSWGRIPFLQLHYKIIPKRPG